MVLFQTTRSLLGQVQRPWYRVRGAQVERKGQGHHRRESQGTRNRFARRWFQRLRFVIYNQRVDLFD